jgi:hypothetical protein|uniref:Uncharacterized protein n=1 Tax=Desulfobacca acetoxidans TaxID=60893 RepID=A0A7C3V794_9BACT
MTIPLARKIEGKKFMWDGTTYDSKQKAYEVSVAYKANGFETQIIEEDGNFLVYSRRVAAVESSG